MTHIFRVFPHQNSLHQNTSQKAWSENRLAFGAQEEPPQLERLQVLIPKVWNARLRARLDSLLHPQELYAALENPDEKLLSPLINLIAEARGKTKPYFRVPRGKKECNII